MSSHGEIQSALPFRLEIDLGKKLNPFPEWGLRKQKRWCTLHASHITALGIASNGSLCLVNPEPDISTHPSHISTSWSNQLSNSTPFLKNKLYGFLHLQLYTSTFKGQVLSCGSWKGSVLVAVNGTWLVSNVFSLVLTTVSITVAESMGAIARVPNDPRLPPILSFKHCALSFVFCFYITKSPG